MNYESGIMNYEFLSLIPDSRFKIRDSRFKIFHFPSLPAAASPLIQQRPAAPALAEFFQFRN